MIPILILTAPRRPGTDYLTELRSRFPAAAVVLGTPDMSVQDSQTYTQENHLKEAWSDFNPRRRITYGHWIWFQMALTITLFTKQGHILLLEDDARPANTFDMGQVEELVNQVAKKFPRWWLKLQRYPRERQRERKIRSGPGWYEIPETPHGGLIAQVVQASLIEDLVAFQRKLWEEWDGVNDDEGLARFLKSQAAHVVVPEIDHFVHIGRDSTAEHRGVLVQDLDGKQI